MKVCYNTSLPFLNNPKDLDPSYKMDLDIWGCFGRKIILSYKYGKYATNVDVKQGGFCKKKPNESNSYTLCISILAKF